MTPRYFSIFSLIPHSICLYFQLYFFNSNCSHCWRDFGMNWISCVVGMLVGAHVRLGLFFLMKKRINIINFLWGLMRLMWVLREIYSWCTLSHLQTLTTSSYKMRDKHKWLQVLSSQNLIQLPSILMLTIKAPTPSDRRYIPRVNFGTNNEFLPKPTLIYKYCKNVGHLIGKCYKLHGYPHFKFTKGTKTVIHVEVHIENPLVHLSMQGHLNTVPTLDLSFLVSPRNNIHNW